MAQVTLRSVPKTPFSAGARHLAIFPPSSVVTKPLRRAQPRIDALRIVQLRSLEEPRPNATIGTDGAASIHAEFTNKSDLKAFFKTFAKFDAMVRAALSAACSTPKGLALSVQFSGTAFTFAEAVREAAGALTDDDLDELWLNEATAVKSSVLAASTATASLIWNPFDSEDKGMLIRLDAELQAALLPPSDNLQHCRQDCEYLHRMLGSTGVLTLSGGIDTDQDADFPDDDDLVGTGVADDAGEFAGDVIKFFLKGSVTNAVIPLPEAGAELEDLGLVFRLELPRSTRRRRDLGVPSTSLALKQLTRMRRNSNICPIDLMILVDRSNSIYRGCPLQRSSLLCWNKMKDFLVKVVGELNIGTGPNDARVGLNYFDTCTGASHSSSPSAWGGRCGTLFKLGDHDTNAAVVKAINDNLDHGGGQTHTKVGMEILRSTLIKESFDRAAASSDRQNPHRLVLVLTDGGYSGYPNQKYNPANVAKDIVTDPNGAVDIMAVGIGHVEEIFLADIAGGNPSMIRPPPGATVPLDFDKLGQEVGAIAAKFCTTTTAAATTNTAAVSTPVAIGSTVPTAVPSPAPMCGVDLVFVVDVSSSINDMCKQKCGGNMACTENDGVVCWPNCPGHTTCWESMKNFVAESVKQFDIGSGAGQTQVALVTFGSWSETKFDFNDQPTVADVSAAIDDLEYERCLTRDPTTGEYLITAGGWCQERSNTHTSLGLQAAKDLFASTTSGVRSAATVKRVVVAITDGEASENYSPVPLAKELLDDGVLVLGVGVNLRPAGKTALAAMSGPPPLNVEDFDELPNILSDLRDAICDSLPVSGSGTSTGGTGSTESGGSGSTGSGGNATGGIGAGNNNGGATVCNTADGYLWSLAITATLKLAERQEPFSAAADQLSVNDDGSGGVLLPGGPDETSIDTAQLEKITNDALRLRGEIGFRVWGKEIDCLKKATGRFYFGLADGEALMSVLGSPYAHLHGLSVELKWNFATFPYMRELIAQGKVYVGSYGRAALCVLGSQCSGVVDTEARFTVSQDVQKGTKQFGISAFLRPQGSNALVDLYNSIAAKVLSTAQQQRLALLSALDYGVIINIVAGEELAFDIELVGELSAAKLPPYSQDDLVDGDCNVICQKLHDAFGSSGTGSAQVAVKVKWAKEAGLHVELSGKLSGTSIELGSTDSDSPSVTLVGLNLMIWVAASNQGFDGVGLSIGASLDLGVGPKLKGELGFAVTNEDDQRVRYARGLGAKAYFRAELREPYYAAFGSESTHIIQFELDVEVSGGNGQSIGLPKLEASGELCLGRREACSACEEGKGVLRLLDPICQGQVFAEIEIGIRIPGQSNIDEAEALVAPDKCEIPGSDGGKWEFYIQATVEASNGVGALSRIQNALAGDDASEDVNERMNTFAAVKVILGLTLGPSRVKLGVEAQLHKLDLPPNDVTATSTSCDMICQLCHKLLDKAEPGSYIFVKGEFGATVSPFSLTVAIGAGFDGLVEFPDKGLTLTRTGITLIFAMDPVAIEFGIKLYGSIVVEQDDTYGPEDGLVPSSNGVVLLKDSHTGEVYGQMTQAAMDNLTTPLVLDGAFQLKLVKGQKGECGTPSTPGGVPGLKASIDFAMTGWNMKFIGKRCHIGNIAFNLAVTSAPPYFDTFAGQAEICIGTTGRCANCVLGSSVEDCPRTISMASYIGIGIGRFFSRMELYSALSLRGFLETFDLDRRLSLPNGINLIDFGPRPGQRAAVFSLSTKKQVISTGYDVKTQTYDGNTLTIPMGLVIDGRVTLFPDVSWLRFTADFLLILGTERILIDYTQSPISWGCDSSGDGCVFELTGYDHTPTKPQGPRFYISLVFKKKRNDVPDMSADDVFDAIGKEPLDDGNGRRRGRRDGKFDRPTSTSTAAKSKPPKLPYGMAQTNKGCTKRYLLLPNKATFFSNPVGAYRACLEPSFDGVLESRLEFQYVEVDMETYRISELQEHKFKVQLSGNGYGGPTKFGEVRDCTQQPNYSKDRGTGVVDLRGTMFAVANGVDKCTCEGRRKDPQNPKSPNECVCGQWRASGHLVSMTVHCTDKNQLCVVKCTGASGRCFLERGYLQLVVLYPNQLKYENDNLRSSNTLFMSDAEGCAPVVPCCTSWCEVRGKCSGNVKCDSREERCKECAALDAGRCKMIAGCTFSKLEFWPVETSPWNCCNTGKLCCSDEGFEGKHCNIDGHYTYEVHAAAINDQCDPRPYCTLQGPSSSTETTTKSSETSPAPTAAFTSAAPTVAPTISASTPAPTTTLRTTSTAHDTTAGASTTTGATTQGLEALSGTTPQGQLCVCDCKVCDPPPKFVPIAGAADGTGLLASIRVLSLKECERSCATKLACKAMWFKSRTSKEAFSFRNTAPNCKLYADSKRARRGRPRKYEQNGLLYDVNRAAAPANTYVLLTGHNDEHHDGASLLWTAATTISGCKLACDTTVKCTGFSVYTGVTDGQSCRLLGDDVIHGPWTPAASGPWRSDWATSACGGEPIVEAGLYRWNESVQVVSYMKSTGGEMAMDRGYVPASRSDDEIFIGETLFWSNASNEDDCMAECMRQPHCTGVSFELADSTQAAGVRGRRCHLAASPMDDPDSWIADDVGRRRRQDRSRRVHLTKTKSRPKLARKDCTCREPVSVIGKESTTTTVQTSTTGVSATTIAATENTRALIDEVSCVGDEVGSGDPTQTCILIHARTNILGLAIRTRIQLAKDGNSKWQASLDAEGSLFGTFLRATFGVRVALSKPRSFRCFGEIAGQSKEEILNKVKAKLQETADKSKARFEARRAYVEQIRQMWIGKISAKQQDVDSKRAAFESKAANLRAKADVLAANRLDVQNRRSELDTICTYRCCTKSCEPKWRKRQACHAHNAWCAIKRAPKAAALLIVEAALFVAEVAVNAAAALVDAAQVVLDVAIWALEGVKKASEAALWLAQKGLNALEKLYAFGLRVAAKILEGAFNLFYFNEWSFDFELSKDSRYLKYHLDCTLFGKRIILDSHLDFSSFGKAIGSLVRAIVDLVKAIFKNNKKHRREVSTSWVLSLPHGAKPADGAPSLPALVSPVRRYHPRRSADVRNSPETFEIVCEGQCICHACIRNVKRFFSALHATLFSAKEAQVPLRRAELIADSRNTATSRETMVAGVIADFKADALAQRASAHEMFATVEDECALAENVSSCIYLTTVWDAELQTMEADSASVAELMNATRDSFAADEKLAAELHNFADNAERNSWRDVVGLMLYNATKNGIGCPDFECGDVGDCLSEAAGYVADSLEILADDSLCADGYSSDDNGGCDHSEHLVHQQAALLALQWRAILPGLSVLFVPVSSETAATLAEALTAVTKAQSVLGAIAPIEFCDGHIMVTDTSEPIGATSRLRGSDLAARHALPPQAPVYNLLLNQFATYSTICDGSGLSLTDGTFVEARGFSTCSTQDSEYVEIPTAELGIISAVRVGKHCPPGQTSDPTVVGLVIQLRSATGNLINCASDAGTTNDATCSGDGFWERTCEPKVAVSAVRVHRQGPGAISVPEIQALGRPMAVSNVVLGQRVSSTSQCHERPSFKPVSTNNDMYPIMPGVKNLNVTDRSNCLNACSTDDGCVAASFFVAPFRSPEGNNCLLYPNTLLSADVVFVNAPGVGARQRAEVQHFSKYVPFQHLEALADHVHDGQLLRQACVPDLAECKAKCAVDLHCTGFTLYGDEDDETSASVCAMTGLQSADGVLASKVFADGPFARLPTSGISANLGRPPRVGESSEYTSTENYAIVLGVDKITDGFYQPLAPSGEYARQGFLHTCGETDADEVVISTSKTSRVFVVRVWKRCDCCQERAAGLQVLQYVAVSNDGGISNREWRACGTVSSIDDAACSVSGPEEQFWERSCDYALPTFAIKIIRVKNTSTSQFDEDYRSLDLPEVEAFGTTFFESSSVAPDVDEFDLDPKDIMTRYNEATVPTVPAGADGCEPDLGSTADKTKPGYTPPLTDQNGAVHTEPLIVCTISTTPTSSRDRSTSQQTTSPSGSESDGGNEGDVNEPGDLEDGTVDTDASNDGPQTPWIIIGIILGVLVLLIIVAMILWKKSTAADEDSTGSAEPPHGESGVMHNPTYDEDDEHEAASTTGELAPTDPADGYLSIPT